MKAATLAGVALVAAHAVGFVALAAHSRGSELAIELDAPLAAPELALDGAVPPAIASRVTIHDDGAPPGLVRRRWSIAYRGGITREVGATQLVGPFQDPAAPPCSGRVVIGQRLLDDGHAGRGTVARAMADAIDGALRGERIFPVGDYQRIEDFALRWAQLDRHPEDRAMVGRAPHGYLRASATVVFERVRVPITLGLVPERAGASLRFAIAARAHLDLDNALEQWLSDKLGADRIATLLARRQLDDLLVTTLAPPPPFELPDHQTLAFSYCDAPIEIADGAWAALPFAVAIHPIDRAVLPPRLPDGPWPVPAADTGLALDLQLGALDAMLYELWRTGWLDRQLAAVGLDRRFNADPTVTEYLSIRLSPLHLALPPVIAAGARAGTLRLAADARVAIADGRATTTGRVFGALDFTFAGRAPVAVDLGALELACERTPTTLVPCYADLVAALRDRGADFHGALTDAFAQLLEDIFVAQLGAADVPAELAIRGATASLAGAPPVLHLALDAAVRPAP
ncbi:MAG TPA: hypothetical protein VLX92_30770 [Kofleriaceae bacterium]|nr:hypothetical protein [Kofleriaceae bacterium]